MEDFCIDFIKSGHANPSHSYPPASVGVNISFHMEQKQHLSCLTGAMDFVEYFTGSLQAGSCKTDQEDDVLS